LDGSRERVKVGFPASQDKVKPTNMPRSTLPDKGEVLKIRELKHGPPIPKVQIINLTFDKTPILTSFGHDNRQRDRFTPRLP